MGLRQPDEFMMGWTEITRAQYRRDDLEYASDLRDAEWQLITPLMPERKRLGRRRQVAPSSYRGGDPLHRHNGLSVAAIAPSLPAFHDRAGILLSLDPRGTVGGHEPYPCDPLA